MSASISYRLLTRIWVNNNIRRSVGRTIILRCNSTAVQEDVSAVKDCKRDVSPALQPGKIHAAVLKKFSENLHIESVNAPTIMKNNEVLIKVNYCAVNGSDVLLTKNLYTCEPTLPMILGYELVGELLEVGEEAQKNGYKVGDKVIALNKENNGGLAEQCVAEMGDIWKIPSSMKSLDAVCLLDNYMTALIALEKKVTLDEDDMILINVGVSNIGLAAADIATNVFRAPVIGICATEDVAALVRDRGAFASFKFKDKKLLKKIEEIAAERNIKAVFDGEDGEYFKKILRCFTDIYKEDVTLKDLLRDDNFAVVVHHLSREGRVVVAGVSATKSKADSDKEKGSFSVAGFNLWEYRKKDPEVYRQAGEDVLQFFEEGLITPTRSLVVGLNKVNDAINFAAEMKSSGKVVVDIRNKETDAPDIKQ